MSNLNLEFIKTNVSDDPDFIKELLEVFLNSLDTDVPALEVAIEKGEHDGIRKAAHKVKSGFRSLGMEEMTTYLQELEDMGKQEKPLEEIELKYKGFLDGLPEVKSEVRGFID